MTHNLYSKYKWLALMVVLSPAQATDLVHHFESPMNGGNPLNGTYLFNQATDQNNFKDPVAVAAAAAAAAANAAATSSANSSQSNIDAFKSRLQNAILNNLVSKSSTALFDPTTGNILPNQTLNFDLSGNGSSNFSVSVGAADTVHHTVTVNISDGITNTSLTVPYTGN